MSSEASVNLEPVRPAPRSASSPALGNRAGTGYIWLAYSLFFFIDPILAHNRGFWIETAVLYSVFLTVYIAYMQIDHRRTRLILLGAFYVLGLVSFPVNSGASSFFIYVAAFLPFAVESVSLVTVLLVGQALGVTVEGIWVHNNRINIAATVGFIAIIGVTNVFIAQHKRSDSKLRLAHAEIEQLAALAERERIARDLHDVLGHTLSVIVLKAELAGRLVERDPARAASEMADVERTARAALTEVREAIGGYRSKGLAAEMELARGTLGAAGVALSCESPLPKLSVAEETVLCLAVREAVTNIVRHAAATECRMRFETTAEGFHALTVKDDGSGFGSAAMRGEGNGLRGMRERVQALGGRLSVRGEAGTTLVVELPVVKTQGVLAPPQCASA